MTIAVDCDFKHQFKQIFFLLFILTGTHRTNYMYLQIIYSTNTKMSFALATGQLYMYVYQKFTDLGPNWFKNSMAQNQPKKPPEDHRHITKTPAIVRDRPVLTSKTLQEFHFVCNDYLRPLWGGSRLR